MFEMNSAMRSGSDCTNSAIAMLLLAYLSAGCAALTERSKPIEPVFPNGTVIVAWRLFDNRMIACSARLRLNQAIKLGGGRKQWLMLTLMNGDLAGC
jgi:hypothetical protein